MRAGGRAGLWRDRSGRSCRGLVRVGGNDALEGGADICRAGISYKFAGNAFRQHTPAMQDDEIVALGDLVDQMRRPQDADILVRHESAHVPQNAFPRVDIEPDCRLVEQQ